MSQWFSLALDGILLVLLVSVLVLGIRLGKRLRILQQMQGELQNLTQQFSISIKTADNALRTLKLTVQEQGGELDSQIRKAQSLSDELQFIVNAADKLATRLTDQLTPNQTQAINHAAVIAKAKEATMPAPALTVVPPKPAPVAPPQTRSRAEAELLSDLEKITQARQLQEGKAR